VRKLKFCTVPCLAVPAQQKWSLFILTPIISIRLNVTSQARVSAEILISYVYCKFVINQYPIGPYIKPKSFHHQYLSPSILIEWHVPFVSSTVSIEHRVVAQTSGKKHCGSISFLILKCSFVTFEVDKIKVKFKWFMTCEVIHWRNHVFCNLHEWMFYSPWWLKYRTLTCPHGYNQSHKRGSSLF